METKDQRIELRLPQQQLEDLDNFISNIEGQYKPSRSDVLRTFIAQGIRGKFTPASQEAEMFPLAARLNLFFQLCQLQQSSNVLPRAFDHLRYTIPNYTESTVTAEALVRQVYLQRYMWFFELDVKHLQSINDHLRGDQILSLMDPQHNQEVCNTLDTVMAIRDMFARIGQVMEEAEQKAGDEQSVSAALARIRGYATDYDVPLTFKGYPNTAAYTQQIQMWALVDWIDEGEGKHTISEYRLRQDKDMTSKYAIMLEIYQDICSNHPFNLDGLEQMVKSRRFDCHPLSGR
ncbi:TPA: hypothetical protein ACKP7A_004686 [Serratia liquefaciens]|jgi:hypothetical protein|uniref:hypothetical protein n=1 Tax=Serratia TaxID=613 RepID=UPI0010221BB6|nr:MULTISPECIES: hypothetical protein [Serratia]RYM68072.1 hypothetical protein BSR00_24555 [Serratia liquefaciens]RYM76553.1 hypothetical protein BSR01_21105 [Serratia liquefaciens]CAI1207839.1 Uncharacterised protein [Serratia liquefaciens]CAI2017958.1 Uncharacterised protein [Serratia liquefaciens]CAI2022012.1 Uncharacterised protein [Serratia liquefaciens]